MNGKVLTIVSLSVAVVALAVSVAVRSVKRAETARFAAERAASEEETANRESRKAEAEQKTAEANRRAAEAKAKAEADAKERAKIERETQELATREAERNAEAKAAEKAAAKEKSREAADRAATAKAEAAAKASEAAAAAAAAAKAKAEAETALAKSEAEKAKLDAFVAEAKALELRKIDFETAERELMEFRQELDERERALRPDKTTADLQWLGEREPDEIGGTNAARKVVRKAVRPEDDLSLPRPTRELARCEREVAERSAELSSVSSNAVVTALERLYAKAREENRVIDADFYRRSILLLYPQWVYRPSEAKKEVQP